MRPRERLQVVDVGGDLNLVERHPCSAVRGAERVCALPAYELPDPLPDRLNPPGVLTADAPYLWRPLQPSRRPAWDKRLARLIDGYRYGYTAVILDAHC